MFQMIVVWLIVFAIVEIIGLFIYFQSVGFKIVDFSISTDKKLEKDLSIVLLTDLHDTNVDDMDNISLLDAIDGINPDFVLLSGDMITSYMQPRYNSDITFSFLKRLSEKYTVYYGLGNHEQRYLSEPEKFVGKFDFLKKTVEGYGIHFLNNGKVDLEDSNVSIYGLNIPIEYYRRVVTKKLPEDYVESVFGKNEPDRFNILLAHNPDQFPIYAKWKPDIVCSGHVHGGIVRIPGIGGIISPQLKLFPKYDWGIYEENGSKMILSRGIGWHTIPIRIFNKAELVHITISGK